MPEQIEDIRSNYEQRIDAVASKNAETLASVRELLAGIPESLKKSMDVSQLDMAEAMETELQSLREQADTDEELVQLGLAVAVINHEFVAAIKMNFGAIAPKHSKHFIKAAANEIFSQSIKRSERISTTWMRISTYSLRFSVGFTESVLTSTVRRSPTTFALCSAFALSDTTFG